jgi:hypothetical protein
MIRALLLPAGERKWGSKTAGKYSSGAACVASLPTGGILGLSESMTLLSGTPNKREFPVPFARAESSWDGDLPGNAFGRTEGG